MEYLIKFNEDGRRGETYVVEEKTTEQVQALLDDGFEIIGEDVYQLLLGNVDGNEYIKNPQTGDFEMYIPPEPSLEELKEAKFNEIKNAYLEELYAPVWFEQTMAQPNGKTGPKKYVGYDTDQNSQIDFNSSYKRAQLKGSTLYNIYVNPDNLKEKEFTYHTPEMFDAALLAAGEYQEGVYVKYYTVKAQVEAATTEEELESIVWA